MSGEQAETLPEDLDTWLDQQASEDGVDRDDLLVRAVAAYRILEGERETLDDADGTREQLTEEVDRLDTRLAAVEDDVDTKIDDVRSRLVQVKREVDTKAPTEHGHPGLADRVDTAGATATEALDRIGGLGDRLDRGFENYEEVLTYLRDTTDDLDDDVTRLAYTLVDLRDRTAALEATMERHTAAVDLKREANRQSITDATCAGCDSTVHLGLLSVPQCPHCERGFVDVEPARGFFGSATLTVGDPPALDGETTSPPSEHTHSENGDD
ncbi:Predicted nucleic acid-binding protein, contains Zn-ribbon domain [Halogranum rubrum]|uniref:Predicted nucleic acid-binding protein, contains Zn-ribbon domain n=1 Tax=Halogranum rubrum TaxID=553466 RepID=A0A1I4C1R9_9EURY|nr:hypothetical protein [Halogranum rubrum]SFK74723.1 Predicted nucleic acid-binding protein, contains Zn-ribbon domain [Halogranum rubrum]